MSDELDEIREIFIEECRDGLTTMEKGLLQLDEGGLDAAGMRAAINEIFRAAHSIKGGGATFGFPEISAFTHVLETLLGRLRDGSLVVDRAAIDLLLAAVDRVGGMVAGLAGEVVVDTDEIEQVRHAMETFMAAPDAAEAPPPEVAPVPASGGDAETSLTPADGASAGTDVEAARHHEYIRVDIAKIDALINLVGELIITQSMLTRLEEAGIGTSALALRDALDLLRRNTRELQESAMRIRMLPIGNSFQRFPRLVRDLGHKLGKQVALQLSGEATELDKTVLERISDPLTHLVRNALDHGLETPAVRRAMGKPETGTVHLNAYHKGGHIHIEISDDGAGLNTARILDKARRQGLIGADDVLSEAEIHRLIFLPGFSTVELVSDLSGRGVGMDVVVRNIEALGGQVEVHSEEGRGSTFSIRLPLTLAIVDGQLARVGDAIYVLPLRNIIQSVELRGTAVGRVAGRDELFRLRDEYIPVLSLRAVLGDAVEANVATQESLLVVVESDGGPLGLRVDALLGQQQVVIKSLETNFRQVPGIQGATILGDGRVALIVDTAALAAMHRATRAAA